MAKKMRSFGGKSYRNPSSKGQNMHDLLKQANEAQSQMQALEEEFDQRVFEFSSGGGAVKIVMKGNLRVEDLTMEPELAEDAEMLKDLLMAAFNQGVEEIQRARNEAMEQITGGLNMPF